MAQQYEHNDQQKPLPPPPRHHPPPPPSPLTNQLSLKVPTNKTKMRKSTYIKFLMQIKDETSYL